MLKSDLPPALYFAMKCSAMFIFASLVFRAVIPTDLESQCFNLVDIESVFKKAETFLAYYYIISFVFSVRLAFKSETGLFNRIEFLVPHVCLNIMCAYTFVYVTVYVIENPAEICQTWFMYTIQLLIFFSSIFAVASHTLTFIYTLVPVKYV